MAGRRAAMLPEQRAKCGVAPLLTYGAARVASTTARRHTKSKFLLVVLVSRQNLKRLRQCFDFGATGHEVKG